MTERKDESPYPRIFEPTGNAYPGGVFLIKQDDAGPPDEMKIIRKMIAHQDPAWKSYYIGLELFRKVPREYPPGHVGDETRGIGIQLNLEEATALWYSLGEWIAAESWRQEELLRTL